jgi:superfamily II RNA helicase
MVTILNKAFEGELVHPFKYDLDNFQKHSVNLMNTVNPCNILVTAHTGSGKSLVAEYAILKAIELGKKVIYCSPIKTLSNQKFFEFTHKYPQISTGIITGDNKHNPMADCLIMTTEILMIMLAKKDIKINEMTFSVDIENEVYAIVFDEVHYINDQERGNVWEKSIMMIPKNVSIIMLSATIDKPQNFLTWVKSVNENPSFLLSNEKRVVPLVFKYGIFSPKIPKEFKKDEHLFNRFNHLMELEYKNINEEIMNKYIHFSKFYRDTRVNFRWLITECAKKLHKEDMCPAIFFVFSKKTCFSLADAISEHFNDDNESRQVEKDMAYYLSKLEHKDDYMKTPQYYKLLALAKKGIGVHHSGLIPVFKEIIEMLFSKNLIKVLFCTETFAVGLNMPTKTVVFTDIFKFDNSGKRILHSHEFIQMSGRAGRRGLDKIGHIILLPQVFTDIPERLEFKNLMLGNPQTIKSKFYVDANLILDSIRQNKFENLEEFVKKTLMNAEMDKKKVYLDSKMVEYESKLKTYVFKNYELYEEHASIVAQLNDIIQPSNNQRKRMLVKLKEIEQLPEYKKEYPLFISFRDVNKNLKDCTEEREVLNTFIVEDIKNTIKFLTENKYFEDEKLTLKGQVSLTFRELDNVMGAEIVFSEYVDTLGDREYLSLLTMITDGRNSDQFEIPEDHIPIWSFVESMFPNHVPNREYIRPILDWYDGSHISDIINQFGIFEGDLIKNINKIINFIEELNEGYVLKNTLKYVEMLNKIKDKLQREIVSTESLYLKL